MVWILCYYARNPKYATIRGAEMEANKIRAKIKEKGLNQNCVAEKIGISANSLSKALWKTRLYIDGSNALCDVLDIKNPQEIF